MIKMIKNKHRKNECEKESYDNRICLSKEQGKKHNAVEKSSYLLHNEKANRIMQKLQLARMALVKKLIGDKKGKVLDIGCRYGHLEQMLGKGFDYYGLDVIKYNPHPRRLHLTDLNENGKLKYPDKFFDVIVATEILEHLFFIDEVYAEILRVLKDDGIAIISLPNDYQIDARIKYALGRSSNTASPSNKFGHHWSFDINSSKEFLKEKSRILQAVNIYASRGARITPSFIKNFLANNFPDLFVTTTVYKIEKKRTNKY